MLRNYHLVAMRLRGREVVEENAAVRLLWGREGKAGVLLWWYREVMIEGRTLP